MTHLDLFKEIILELETLASLLKMTVADLESKNLESDNSGHPKNYSINLESLKDNRGVSVSLKLK